MNQNENRFDLFQDEPTPRNTDRLPDISQEIGADVEAIMAEDFADSAIDTVIDTAVLPVSDATGNIATDVDALIESVLPDPSDEIGADVEAIMASGLSDLGESVSSDLKAITASCLIDPEGALSQNADMTMVVPEVLPEPAAEPMEEDIPAEYADAAEALHVEETVPEYPEEATAFVVPVAESCADAAFYAEPAVGEAAAPEPACESSTPVNNEATQFLNSDDPLYHELLNAPVVGSEIGADEHAVYGAGLLHPGEAEVDQMIAEAKVLGETTAIDMETTRFTPNDYAMEGSLPQDANGEDIVIQDYFDPNHPQDQPVEEMPEEEPPLPKRRPKMKKGYGLFGIPHVISTLIWLAITVVIGVSLGRMIWVCTAEVLAFGKPDQKYSITITDADNIDTVATKLKNAGIIKYPELFKLYASITEAEEELSSGTFTLNSKYDYNALVKAMTYHSSARETVEVIIPEGYTCAQIFALLEEKNVCSVEELEEYAANGEIKDRWFLEGITRGDKYCLEGYLFPDTYEFYTDDEPGRVLGKFLDNFDARFTDIMKDKIDPLNERMAEVLASRGYTQDYIDAHKFTIREIVIIASMIERETANDSESYDIASVIYNRLTNPKEYLYLNIDATIIYALGGNIDPATGKTKPLTSEDLKLNSPYNTYTEPGLIPGPISNPGRNSINAALDPNVTKYYFYVYNPNTGKHMFAKTAAEHDKNVEYVRSLEKDDG